KKKRTQGKQHEVPCLYSASRSNNFFKLSDRDVGLRASVRLKKYCKLSRCSGSSVASVEARWLANVANESSLFKYAIGAKGSLIPPYESSFIGTGKLAQKYFSKMNHRQSIPREKKSVFFASDNAKPRPS